LVRAAKESAEKDNERMAGRKLVIEKKKEEQERLLLQAEREEEEKRAVQERLTAAAEEERRRIDRSLSNPFLSALIFPGVSNGPWVF